MVKKKAYNFTVIIEQGRDGWFVATVPAIQGCYTQGKTIEQTMERVKEAIQVCLEADNSEPSNLKFIGLQNIQVKV